MNSLKLLNAGVYGELRYFQIETQSLLRPLLQEVSGLSTGTPPGFKLYKEMAYGLLEMGITEFAIYKGRPLEAPRFNMALARKYTLLADREPVIEDIAHALHLQVLSLIDKTYLEYPFAYRVLVNGNILVGIDVRDLEKVSAEEASAEEWNDYEQNP
jgi:hypothetical protein